MMYNISTVKIRNTKNKKQREVINMFFKSISGTCYCVTNEKKKKKMKNLCGYEVITKEEFDSWCKSCGYTADEFTIK